MWHTVPNLLLGRREHLEAREIDEVALLLLEVELAQLLVPRVRGSHVAPHLRSIYQTNKRQ